MLGEGARGGSQIGTRSNANLVDSWNGNCKFESRSI
jgi:hypothetical protein